MGFNGDLEKKIIIDGNKEVKFPSDKIKERIEAELNRRELEGSFITFILIAQY